MKPNRFLPFTASILFSMILFSGCKPNPILPTTEIPTPTIQSTPHPLDLGAVKSFCTSVSGTHTEGVEEVLGQLLKALNYQVANTDDACDATISIQLEGTPQSASYQVNNTSEYRECFTGGQFTGEISITAENAIPISVTVNEIKIPPTTIVDICPDLAGAPFKDIWPKALINNMQKIMGDKVYVAAQQVEALRGEHEWLGDGPYSRELVDGLITLLDNEDPWTRWNAAMTLSFMRPVPAEAMPALMKRIGVEQSRQPDVLSLLWGAIKNAEQIADPLLPQIIDILNTSSDGYSRELAAETIGHIGRSTPEAVSALIKALNDPEALVRMWAARSLGVIKAPLSDSAQPLIGLLTDPDSNVRQAAGQSLGEICGHPEIDPENAAAWQAWLDTPATPTPVITRAPEDVLRIKVPEEILNIWGQFNGRYVVYVHKNANIQEFANLDGLNWYVGFIGAKGQDFEKQVMGKDVARLAGITSIHMEIITMESPDEFVDYLSGNPAGNDVFKLYFLGRPDFVGFMVPEVASFYQFDRNPDLIRVEFE